MENNKKIIDSCWLDNETYLIRFEEVPTTKHFELQGVTEQVVAEYHKDEKRWGLEKQYFEPESGLYIDRSTDDFTPMEEAEYLTIAQREYKAKATADIWCHINMIDTDDYQSYNNLVDMIKNYYTSKHGNSEKVAMEVECDFNSWFIELIEKLNKKYLM